MQWLRTLTAYGFALVVTATSSGAFAAADTARNAHNGTHDFDFHFGAWKTHIQRLRTSKDGRAAWTSLDGTMVTRPLWNGRANLEEVRADGPGGRFESLALFLYDPHAHQWNVNFASSGDGSFATPVTGAFANGRGEFYGPETENGKHVLARVVWSNISATSHHFEQALSSDGGATWRPDFIADLTRDPAPAASEPIAFADADRNGSRAFAFDIGTWRTRSSRLLHPLSGSKTWIEMDGVTTVAPVWNGRANIAVLESDGPRGHLELLSLRLYDPAAHQWSLSFATSPVGQLAAPTIGGFASGRGTFYDQETYAGRTILMRFRMIPLSATSARSEQAFSDDGGKTWETNWINRYTRIG